MAHASNPYAPPTAAGSLEREPATRRRQTRWASAKLLGVSAAVLAVAVGRGFVTEGRWPLALGGVAGAMIALWGTVIGGAALVRRDLPSGAGSTAIRVFSFIGNLAMAAFGALLALL